MNRRDLLLVLTATVASCLLMGGIAVGAVWWLFRPAPQPHPGPEPAIVLPPDVQTRVGEFTTIEASTHGKTVRWHCDGPAVPGLIFEGPHKAHFVTPTPGDYHLLAWTALHGEATDAAACTIHVSGVGPVPPGPNPPGPGPNPPGPAPIPADGLHVLLVYDKSDLGKMPKGQELALRSDAVRAYLNGHCPAGPDGKTKSWRLWDREVDATGESKLWQDAFKRPRTGLPWIVVSNPQKGGGYEGPLPADEDGMLKLLKKYGGE